MTEKKKVIKVNDLTIEAENVHFAPNVSPEPGRPVDPLFGPRRPWVREPQAQPERESEEQVESDSNEDADTDEDDQKETEQSQPEQRPPFSWL